MSSHSKFRSVVRSSGAMFAVGVLLLLGPQTCQNLNHKHPGQAWFLAPAHAHDMTVNVGAGATNSSNFKEGTIFTGDTDSSDSSWTIGVGLPVATYVDVELAYVDLGELKFDGLWGGVPDVGTDEIDGTKLAVVFWYPIGNPWTVTGTLGLFDWKIKTEEEYGSPAQHLSSSDSGTDPVYGLGLRFAVTKFADLRVEWERYTKIDDDIDVDVFGAKFIWNLNVLDYLEKKK